MTFEEAKKKCCAGEITTVDAAVLCGMSRSQFYTKIRADAKAYITFLSNAVKRNKLQSEHWPEEERLMKTKQKQELREKQYYAKVMKKYESKTMPVLEAKARALGLSYGQYVAKLAGLGRVD